MSKQSRFDAWWNSLDDDDFQGWIDGLGPHEVARLFAKKGYAAATKDAVGMCEDYEFGPMCDGRCKHDLAAEIGKGVG